MDRMDKHMRSQGWMESGTDDTEIKGAVAEIWFERHPTMPWKYRVKCMGDWYYYKTWKIWRLNCDVKQARIIKYYEG